MVLELWLLFIAGQVLYVLKRAHFAVSNQNGAKASSLRHYFALYWIPLLFRGVAGSVIFWTFAVYPDVFSEIAGKLGVSVNWKIKMVPPVVLALGIASDAVLDVLANMIPWLKRELPVVNAVADSETAKPPSDSV